MDVFTIGHSNRALGDFMEMLASFGIKQVADVRTIPKSRFNPQFNQSVLSTALRKNKIKYAHLALLGGLRHAKKDSVNTGWKNASFRGFADYMQTDEFAVGLDELIKLSKTTTAIMCAEALPWRCHRSLIADALTIRGIKVLHIMSNSKTIEHTLTSFAVVDGKNIVYR